MKLPATLALTAALLLTATPAVATPPAATPPAATAWELFDAYGAELLPDHPTRVEYVRSSSTPIVPGAGTIVVWDHTGTHHLFTVTAQ